MENRTTTIRVQISTKQALEKLGVYSESMDGIIRRIMELHKKKKGKQTATEKRIAAKL